MAEQVNQPNQDGQVSSGIKKAGRFIRNLDLLTDIIAILAIFFGLKPKNEATKTLEEKSKDNPLYSWLLSVLYPLSDIDERLRDQLLYNAFKILNIPELKTHFFRFVDNLEKHGWDPDHFRIMMIIMYRDYLDSDKGVHCDVNTAFEILRDISDLDGNYDKQEYMAEHLSLLSKAGPLKKLFKVMHTHKLRTLLFLVMTPPFVISVIYLILKIIFD